MKFNFKKFYYENQVISILVIAFIVILIADLISTLSLKELYPYLEANVLFSTFGIFGILIFNILLLLGGIYYYNQSNDPHYRFVILLAFVSFLIIRIFVVYNNIKLGLNPPSFEEARMLTLKMKLDAIYSYIKLNLMTYATGIITYLLFILEHKVKHHKEK